MNGTGRQTPRTEPARVRVVLADDQRLVRESLSRLLSLLDGVEFVASAADGDEAVALAAEHQPDVVLMDIRMPRLDGIEATRRLRERHPDIRVIALTTYADDESVLGALRAGARGYLTKDAGSDDIRAAILAVAAGDATLDPTIQRHVVAALANEQAPRPEKCLAAADDLPDDLTPREAEVLVLIAEGLSNTEIAERLVVSQTTIKSHINHLFTKAHLRDRAQAVNYAYRTGIARPPR
jgi:DNA-binding NarL/FixJ family response regulator